MNYSGIYLYKIMSGEHKKRFFDFRLLRRVFGFVKPYNKFFYASLALAVAMAVFAPVRPLLIQLTVDTATGKSLTYPIWLKWILPNKAFLSAAQLIISITIFQVVFILIESATRFVFSFITAWLGQAVVKDLRNAVYKKVLGLNLSEYDQTPIGTLTTRTINDIESINEIFSDGLIPIVADLLVILITLATMFWMDWRLTLISLVPFPLLIIATYYFKESVNKSFIRVRNAVAKLNAFVQEHLTGMQIVQAFAAEERELKKFDNINKEHRNANIHAIFAYSVFFPVVEVVLAISIGLLVWWIADRQLEAGLLVAFILYLNQLFRPLRVIADKFNVLQMGMVAAERVFKVLDNENVTHNHGSVVPTSIRGEIVFNNVYFGYNKNQMVLKNIQLKVNPGETVAIVGHTGSGKTSMVSLLNRMYPIQAGSITIDGVDINHFQLDALRKHIGVVLQDVFLFSGSIMDNITLRNAAIPESKVIEAAKMIGMHQFIMQLPGGYHFNVMERGNMLSLGQRQLLSFIRALLYNPSILILDEATSSIDTESELLIQKATETLIDGRTSIIIAHRLSTIRKANQIVVLEKGEIVERGTHDELIQQGGQYYKLHQLQFVHQQHKALSAF